MYLFLIVMYVSYFQCQSGIPFRLSRILNTLVLLLSFFDIVIRIHFTFRGSRLTYPVDKLRKFCPVGGDISSISHIRALTRYEFRITMGISSNMFS